MAHTPWLRSPFTDITSNLVTHQWYGRCQDMEMKLVECLEAYGLERGMMKCEDVLADFKECSNRRKQMSRTIDIRMERNKQYWTGERKGDKLYAESPKIDSF